VERKLHHNSAVCHLAAVLATRIVACLRANSPYQIRGSTDNRSPPPNAESSAKNSACSPTNGPAATPPAESAKRHQRSLSASPPDPP